MEPNPAQIRRAVIFSAACMTALFVAGAFMTPPATPAQKPEIKPVAQIDAAMVEVVTRSLLKDPDSAKFEGIRPGLAGAWCGNVNAKNGFGGYTGMRRFVIARPNLFEIEGEGFAFYTAWKERCQ